MTKILHNDCDLIDIVKVAKDSLCLLDSKNPHTKVSISSTFYDVECTYKSSTVVNITIWHVKASSPFTFEENVEDSEIKNLSGRVLLAHWFEEVAFNALPSPRTEYIDSLPRTESITYKK